MKKLLAECFGTMFLVLLACGSAVLAGPNIGTYGIGVCFGLVLICLCYAIGNISGCHVNPAVSLGVWMNGGMSLKEMFGYWVAQFIGAGIGAGLLYWLFCAGCCTGFNYGGITTIDGTQTGIIAANVLQPGASSGMALLTEALLTFFFVYVILGCTDSKVGAGKFAGLAIGIALGLVNIVGIPVDNCSVNPARSFGPALWNSCLETSTAWGDFWIMVVGPCIGAIVAALAWKVTTSFIQKEA